ncbi:hypothetical protein MIR68_005696 [Amoeboaphelidium protococcarum]|nr:hypothetical protein MIR68_005696 [Amoeboaphelidium protococcarum]
MSFEDQYNQIQQIQQNLDTLDTVFSVPDGSFDRMKADRLLQDTENMIVSISTESSDVIKSVVPLRIQLKKYKIKLSNIQSSRANSISVASNLPPFTDRQPKQRDQLYANATKIDAQGEILNRSFQISLESESMGAQTLDALQMQSMGLKRAQKQLEIANEKLTLGEQSVKIMNRRRRNMYLIIAIIMIILIGIAAAVGVVFGAKL